jgi:hypothetical protein
MNSTSMLGYSGVDNDDLTAVALEPREQIFQVRDFFKKYAPGFENSYVLDSAAALGVRETRRIIGEETLIAEDCVEGKKGPRDIGRGAYCLDVHQPSGIIEHKHIKNGESYGIPYGVMVPRKVESCLVTGRCVSSDRFSNGSVRNQAHVMTMGQAAGTAAAMCAERRVSPRELDVDRLREQLQRDGAVV